MKRYLWLAVTPDKYELPLAVAESAGKLAMILGITRENVIDSCIKERSGKYSGRKIVKVEI